MHELTAVNYTTSEQHKDSVKTRHDHDQQDTTKVLHFLEDVNPFTVDLLLPSIATGGTASTAVNVDCAKQAGEKTLKSMVGQIGCDVSFKLDYSSIRCAATEQHSLPPQLFHEKQIYQNLQMQSGPKQTGPAGEVQYVVDGVVSYSVYHGN